VAAAQNSANRAGSAQSTFTEPKDSRGVGSSWSVVTTRMLHPGYDRTPTAR
jgi:hypothetical protein